VSDLDCPELRDKRVLVVDDDADTLDVLAAVLEYNGARVATAQSVAEALAVFERERPHVLISDVTLPDEDGFSLLRKLRSLPASRGGNVPAIALTGYDALEDRERVRGEGFHAHLVKPVELASMLAAVSLALQSPLSGPASKAP
jgi:CheY-like chemotaxis protein